MYRLLVLASICLVAAGFDYTSKSKAIGASTFIYFFVFQHLPASIAVVQSLPEVWKVGSLISDRTKCEKMVLVMLFTLLTHIIMGYNHQRFSVANLNRNPVYGCFSAGTLKNQMALSTYELTILYPSVFLLSLSYVTYVCRKGCQTTQQYNILKHII